MNNNKNSIGTYITVILGLMFGGAFRVALLALTFVGLVIVQRLAFGEMGFTSYFGLWAPVKFDSYWQWIFILGLMTIIFLLFQVFFEKPPHKVEETKSAYAVTGTFANTCWVVVVWLLFLAIPG